MSDDPNKAPASFEARLRAARDRHGMDTAPPGPAAPRPPSALGVGLRMGVELVAALVVAVLIGWALDRWFGTMPVMICLFVLLGGAAGVLNVWRAMGPGKGRA